MPLVMRLLGLGGLVLYAFVFGLFAARLANRRHHPLGPWSFAGGLAGLLGMGALHLWPYVLGVEWESVAGLLLSPMVLLGLRVLPARSVPVQQIPIRRMLAAALAPKLLFRSVLVSGWFVFLTFPLLVIKVNTIEQTVQWRWSAMAYVALGAFVANYVWTYLHWLKAWSGDQNPDAVPLVQRMLDHRRLSFFLLTVIVILAILFPNVVSPYQLSIMITALIYVVLGLGLNIVVGLAGLLDLGYVAFYAVGAYSYALLNLHFGLGFWAAIPVGMALGALFGILLGIPVLRLRGDYLAIVTLGFGEIIRLVLQNWNEFSGGPSGIPNIPRPSLFGMELSLHQATVYTYYLMMVLVVFTVFVVNRLQNSRLGRSWLALREDDIACQAMGIDRMKTKLAAFALGATWAGMVGVIFAAKTTFINPDSFTLWESIIILSVVVFGGMGSITGVILGALILILLPEYLRAFSEYRMLLFGATMVLMMVFRPQGLITRVRRHYEYHDLDTTAREG